jgi:hypothetical protein
MTAVMRAVGWISRVRWPVNPVVVKELRQAVRSWFINGILLLFLGVLLVLLLAWLANTSTFVSPEQGLGQDLFPVLVVIMAGASLIFIPLYTGARLALERQEANLDLLYITTLSPGRIIRGKLFCGVYLTLLFFSACMPFLVLTHLLRGVDLPTIAFVVALVFGVVCGVLLLAIFIACLPVSTPFKLILALPFTGAMIGLTATLSTVSREIVRGGFVRTLGWGWLTASLLCLLAFGWFYLASVALISPRSHNRALPMRVYTTAAWLLAGVALGLDTVFFGTSPAVPLFFWVVLTVVMIITALVVVVGEPDTLSLRVQRQIPARAGKRLLAFFFFNGAAQGLAWIIVMTVIAVMVTLTVIRTGLLSSTIPSSLSLEWSTLERDFWLYTILVLYAYSYTLSGLFLQRTFFPKRTPLFASIFAFLIPAALAIIPNFVMFLMDRLSWRVLEDRQLGNVFNVLLSHDSVLLDAHLWFAGGWAGIALALNLPWFFRQVRAFKPLARASPPNTAR